MFAGVLLLSLYVLFWPEPATPDSGFPGADKVVHALLFASLAATALLRFGAARGLLAAVLAYAVVSELLQAVLLPSRSGDLWDLLADATGALLGWLLARRLWSQRTR